MLGLAAQLGEAPADVDLGMISDDPLVASYHLTALAPLGPADNYRLLCSPTPRLLVSTSWRRPSTTSRPSCASASAGHLIRRDRGVPENLPDDGPTRTCPPRDDGTANAADSIGDVVELVKAYAKQETLGPLKGVGTWLAMGAAGAALLGLGLSLVVLGVLRLVQVEWTRSATGALSWLSYLIALIVCLGFTVLAISRINRDTLNKESK